MKKTKQSLAVHYYHLLPMGTVGVGGDDHSSMLRLTRDLSAKMILQEQPKDISSAAEPVPAVVDQPQGEQIMLPQQS